MPSLFGEAGAGIFQSSFMRISFCEYRAEWQDESGNTISKITLSILFYEDFFLRGKQTTGYSKRNDKSLSILFYEDFFLRGHGGKNARKPKRTKIAELSILFYEDFFLRELQT